jgi:hypothetical protein
MPALVQGGTVAIDVLTKGQYLTVGPDTAIPPHVAVIRDMTIIGHAWSEFPIPTGRTAELIPRDCAESPERLFQTTQAERSARPDLSLSHSEGAKKAAPHIV